MPSPRHTQHTLHPAYCFLDRLQKVDGSGDRTPVVGKPWHVLDLCPIEDVEDRDQVPPGADRFWEVSVF